MAGEDFYGVLGLKKECTSAELRIAYKKLALKWHPDRFSASGNTKCLEEANKKFQAIQQAYSGRELVVIVLVFCKESTPPTTHTYTNTSSTMSVLSNADKRFLYDIGVYDSNDDDDENGMGEFLNEMATMMSQTKPSENGNETFEELQQMFDEMFQSDIESFSAGSSCSATHPSCSSSSSSSFFETYSNSNGMSSADSRGENANFEGFCFGTGGTMGKNEGSGNSRRKKGRR